MALAAARVIVFDLDGTLIDSDAVKTRAYFDIFPPAAAPAVEDAIRADRYENRFDRIARILRTVGGGAEPARAEVERLAKAYNDICEAHQSACAERPGASRILEKLAAARPVYLCSGTWEESLLRVVRARGWQRHFRAVYGGPRRKADNLERVAGDSGAVPGSILVVGDTKDDLEAARAKGCGFAGVRSGSTDFDPATVDMLEDLEALSEVLRRG
ncbi:MAG: HAD family hydrolase [Planctomycetia bacterium]|nr:HAD family hydrolase [Planctomycetia bacterium]